jgi:Na+/melibiose symporter-like transporter
MAVENWSNNKINALDCNGEKVSLKVISTLNAIPYKTLVKYVTADVNKRTKLGSTAGPINTLICWYLVIVLGLILMTHKSQFFNQQ